MHSQLLDEIKITNNQSCLEHGCVSNGYFLSHANKTDFHYSLCFVVYFILIKFFNLN